MKKQINLLFKGLSLLTLLSLLSVNGFELVKGQEMCPVPVDVVLLMDTSGSMQEPGNGDGKSKMEKAKEAANSFLDNLGSGDQSGLVSFSTPTSLLDPALIKQLSNNHTDSKNKVSSLVAKGATNIGDAIGLGIAELSSDRANDKANKVMILLTDGKANRPNGTGYEEENQADVLYAEEKAKEAATSTFKIFTIGLGSTTTATSVVPTVNETMLQNIADITGAQYYYDPDGTNLENIYQQISQEICQEYGSISGCKYLDSNMDGDIAGEEKLAEWVIVLSGTSSSTQETDELGCYSFSGLLEGGYVVSEGENESKKPFLQTYPIGNIYEIVLSTGEHKENIDFGNADASLCELVSTSSECISEGIRQDSFFHNFSYCDYFSTSTDETCKDVVCSEWVDLECVSAGMMKQERNCTSTEPYTETRETENQECDCILKETGRVCIGTGLASVSYGYDFPYCPEGYSEEVEDSSCGGGINHGPSITVLGSNPFYHSFSYEFTDPGATSSDPEDGDLTSQIVVAGDEITTTTATGTYYINYSVSDSLGLKAYATRTVEVVENEPPSITLLGENPMGIDYESSFSDPGATSSDPEDGDITSDIIVGGDTVNNTSPGSYFITYNVEDSLGLKAPEVVREVIVGEKQEENNNGGGGGGGAVIILPQTTQSTTTTTTEPEEEEEEEIIAECIFLIAYLKYGEDNDPAEVMKLQTFLNQFEGFNLEVNGIFDFPTYEAVQMFQLKYENDVLLPWGINFPTGYVYITTQKKVNEIFCNEQIYLTEEQKAEIERIKSLVESVEEMEEIPEIPGIEDLIGEELPEETEELLADISSGVITEEEKESLEKEALASLGGVTGSQFWFSLILVLLVILLVYLIAKRRKPAA